MAYYLNAGGPKKMGTGLNIMFDGNKTMCGRFNLHANSDDLVDFFELDDAPQLAKMQPRYNIAPTQPVIVVRRNPDSAESSRELTHLLWGLIPSWSRDTKITSKLINARSETIDQKPSFKNAFKRRRCLIPANGFYEWKRIGLKKRAEKSPYLIKRIDNQLMAMAGIWEDWVNKDGSAISTCAIITTTANKSLAELHERMPVILEKHEFDDWLDTSHEDVTQLKKFLKPLPDNRLEFYPVTSKINKTTYDQADCIKRAEKEKTDSHEQGFLF